MILNRENNLSKTKGSGQQESLVQRQQIDSARLVTKKNQKNNLIPSCDTSESLSLMGKNTEYDETSSKILFMDDINKFDESFLFQHPLQLYESKVNVIKQQNGFNNRGNLDFSFNAQFTSNVNYLKLDGRKQDQKSQTFLLLRINQIQINNATLSKELIQIKKQLIRFHQQKMFIFDDIRTKITKKIGLYFNQLSSENRKLRTQAQNGIKEHKKSKQKQILLSHQCQQMQKRISIMNQTILQQQEKIKNLKLQNQDLIRQNEQLFFKTSVSQSHINIIKENQTFFNLKQFQLPIQSDFSKTKAYSTDYQGQTLNHFQNILCTMIDSSKLSEQIKFSLQQISMKINNKMNKSTKRQENRQKICKKIQNYKEYDDYLKHLPFKIKYSLLTISALQISTQNNSLMNIITCNQYYKNFFTPQALLAELKSIWLQRQSKINFTQTDEVEQSKNLIYSSSAATLNINYPSKTINKTFDFELGCDSLSLSKSRSKISLMHDKIQQIKEKIARK